jgi:hypothetical protein
MEKQYTVTLTERQIRDLETYTLSQEMKDSYQARPEILKFYNDLFLTLNNARMEKQEA